MLKRVIDGWNAAPGAPVGWDPERDGDCGALPIRAHPAAPGQLLPGQRIEWCESAWEPTPRELEAIVRGRSVILRIVGWQVLVALYVAGERRHDEVDEGAAWILRYADPDRADEIFAGDSAELEARARFDEQHLTWSCSLFREVARG